jgi:putative ABC transport system permease protein
MGALTHDLRHAVRVLGRSPGLALVVVLTLALGIGANTAIFSVAEALVVRLLPIPGAERVVALDAIHDGQPGGVGPDDFTDWQRQNTVFERMAYSGFTQAVLAGQSLPGAGEPERVTGATVSDGFFPLLGVRPALGRWFLPGDQEAGRGQVVILSHELWRRFAGRADIVGRSLTLGDRSYTVVGVMPDGFRFNEGYPCEYWIPVGHEASGRNVHQYSAYARLRPGVSVASAQDEMSAIARRLDRMYPETNTGWGVVVTPLRDELLGDMRPAILILFAAVGLVLLIACANVASLLMARATARGREITVRRALGASRVAIARLLLTESLLLALAAAALGLILAVWGTQLARAAAPAWLDLRSIVYVDRNVLAFTVALSVLTGLLTGLAPALLGSHADLSAQLRQGTAGAGTGVRHSRTLGALVVTEVALATVLLLAAGLLVRSFVRLLDVNLGFGARDVLVVRLQLPEARYPTANQRAEFYRQLVERVRGLPGVVAAGAVDAIPLGGQYSGGPIEIEGRPAPRDRSLQQAAYREATPDYFRTLGIPLLAGRQLSDRDRDQSERVAVVNETLARRYFGGGRAIGRRIRPSGDTAWSTIVGVVGDVRHSAPERAEGAALYLPHAQAPAPHMFLAVRTSVPTASLAGPVRGAIRTLDPALAPLQVRTMEQAVAAALAPRREILMLIGFFAAVALGLAALGLAGVMWYGVTQRTREIGIRLALGARRSDVLRLVLRRGLALTIAGLAIGLAAALATTRLLSSLLFGTGARDPVVFVVVPVVLAAVAVAADYVPARRAATVDPMVALRAE